MIDFTKFSSIISVVKHFNNEEVCKNALAESRWGDDVICPKCGKHSISISRGIEVGNIFQLGTKYTKSMNMQYLDSEGNKHYPLWYGVGYLNLQN